jgi:hypothetical protein
MIAAAVATFALSQVNFTGSSALVYAKSALITGGATTLIWLAVTWLTKPESDATLLAFYRRVHPTVYGWRRIAKMAPELGEVRDVASNTFNWILGVVLVYGALFGIGKLIFRHWASGLMLLALAAVAGYGIFWDLSRRGWETLSGKETPVAEIASMGD